MRYFDGVASFSVTDFATTGFNIPWGQSRTWSNVVGFSNANNNPNGYGWLDTQLPYIVRSNGSNDIDIAIVVNGAIGEYFHFNSGTSKYDPENFDKNTLQKISDTFILTDSTGNQIVFEDFDTSKTAAEKGSFVSFTDAYGNQTYVDSRWTTTEQIKVVKRVAGSVIETYHYDYLTTGPNTGRLASVVLKVDRGTAVPIRVASYTYYDGTDAFGMTGDLKSSSVTDPAAEKTITGLAWSSGTVTATVSNHGYRAGEIVTISGSTPTGYNGAFVVTSVGSVNTFAYALASNPGSATVLGTSNRPIDNTYFRYYADRTPTSITSPGGSTTATVTLTNHGFVNGDEVNVTGAVQAAFNGTFVITKIDDNQFTYTALSTLPTSASGTITVTDKRGYGHGLR